MSWTLQDNPVLARSFTGHRGVVSGCAFNSSTSQLYTGSTDGSVMVWHMEPKMRAFRLLGHTVRVDVDLYRIANALFTNAWMGSVTILPLAFCRVQGEITGVATCDAVQSLVASSSKDKTVRIWQPTLCAPCMCLWCRFG